MNCYRVYSICHHFWIYNDDEASLAQVKGQFQLTVQKSDFLQAHVWMKYPISERENFLQKKSF